MVGFWSLIIVVTLITGSHFMDTAAIGTTFVLILVVAAGTTSGIDVDAAAGAIIANAKIERSATP